MRSAQKVFARTYDGIGDATSRCECLHGRPMSVIIDGSDALLVLGLAGDRASGPFDARCSVANEDPRDVGLHSSVVDASIG